MDDLRNELDTARESLRTSEGQTRTVEAALEALRKQGGTK